MEVFSFDKFGAVELYEEIRSSEDVEGNISATDHVRKVKTFLEATFLEDSGINRLREQLCRCPGNHSATKGVRHI